MKRGMFITLEGIDGCGKTTACKYISELFDEAGIEHLTTSELYSSKLADNIRNILTRNDSISTTTQLCLIMAARSHHYENVIAPNLCNGVTIICDRYIDSTYAYQKGHVYRSEILEIHNTLGIFEKPDYTLFFDLPITDAMKRLGLDLDIFEDRDVYCYEKVIQTYSELSTISGNFITIDARKSVEEVQEQIKQKLINAGVIK